MKKKLAVLLALALSVSALTACGEDASNKSTELAEATTKPSVELAAVEGNTTDLSALPVEEYVTLGDYKNLTVNVAPKTELDDATLENTVMAYYYNDAQYLAKEKFAAEGTVKDTDVVLIDYTGKKDGVAFEGGTAVDAVLGIGSGSFIDGFESGLVGVKVGDTVDLNLTFPENYDNAELAGAEVVFTVKVKGLVGFEDATIEKFEMTAEIDTVEEYREAVEVTLLYEIENEYYNNLSVAICKALVEICTVNKIPESIYNQQREYVIEQIQSEAAQYGYDGDSYVQMFTGMTLADYAVTVAEEYTKQAVIFQAVANTEGLQVTQEDIDAFVNDYVTNYGPTYGIDSVEAFYEYNTAEDVKTVLLQDKVVTYFSENATIVETAN